MPLAQAFWNWAVLGGLAVNVVTSLLFLWLVSTDRLVASLIVGYGLSVPYNLVALVAVWRSAGRYAGKRLWADLARIVTLIGMALLTIA